MNKLVLQGRLAKEPEITSTQSGITRAEFTLAVNRPYKDKETNEYQTDFIKCRAWRNTAEFISKYFHKGDGMLCEGSMQIDSWDDANGDRQYLTYALINQVEFPLSRPSNKKADKADSKPNSKSKATNGNDAIDAFYEQFKKQQEQPKQQSFDDDTELPFDL